MMNNNVNGVSLLNSVNKATRHLGMKPPGDFRHTYDDVKNTAEFLKARTKYTPEVGVICGSGLGGLSNILQDTEIFDYKDIPNFPVSTAPGHAGKLVFGILGNKPCVLMQGRVHMYEGYPVSKLVFPVRVMKALGVQTLIATNAAGGINDSYKVGDMVILKDHVNLPGMCGLNPLMGPNDDRLGTRFPALSQSYDLQLRKLAKSAACDLGLDDYVTEGVYFFQTGPCFETVTECRLARLLGADLCGMSTVPEVIAARHSGMKVFAMSLVTNMCVMDHESQEMANSEEVLETGKMRSKDMQMLISRLVESI